ncbi:MAG: Xaa-Pro peptidase family protein [Rhodospirillales bacterium]
MQQVTTRHVVANTASQKGAMDYSVPPTDLDAVRLYRLGRVRDALKARDYAAIILYDPLNTRYATDVTDMQLWSMHNEVRYVFVPAEGPVIVFEYDAIDHFSQGIPTVDETRPATASFFMGAGPRHTEMAHKWAAEIDDLLRTHGGGNNRVAIDRMAYEGANALANLGYEIMDGFELMECARVIKSAGEIALMRHAIRVCEAGVQSMRDALEPGITENALWAKLHETNIALGGEWIETRLLASGQRTNPWFQECSMRPIEKGDIVSFDTDLIGPYGYCSDMSRSWICGDVKPNDEQRRLYAMAVEQITHNRELVKAGASLKEIAEKAWVIPDECWPNRYSVLMHGVGLCDEFPSIIHKPQYDEGRGYDWVLEPGMTICVESLIGTGGGKECMKLEEQVLVTEDGYEQLTSYPLEDDWL